MVRNSKKIVRDLALAFLISVSMTASITESLAKNQNETIIDNDGILAQTTRNEIYNLIKENEGIHFRGICRLSNRQMGVVQYHLGVLESNNFVKSVKDGRYKCYFATRSNSLEYRPIDDLNFDQRTLREKLITIKKRKTPKKIIQYLIENNSASHQTLAKITSVSPQAITFHAQRLEKSGIIQFVKNGRQKVYSLTDEVLKILDYVKD